MPPRAKKTVPPLPAEAILVDDGHERWLFYPEDNAYRAALAVEPDAEGVRHVPPVLTEGVRSFTYRTAVEKAEALLAELAIPWEELRLSDIDVQQGNLLLMSEKLARITHHIVVLNNRLTGYLARQTAAKEVLEHAVNRNMARPEENGRRLNKDVRIAVEISRAKPLRNMKIELIEDGAAIKVLELTRDSLDLMWRTVSRCISARTAEPLDRD